MERAAWTDERLDDLANRMDAGFERVDRDIRELRAEMRIQMESLRTTMLQVGGGLLVGLLGVIATVLASG
jgi:hypothetical protein